MMKNKRSFRALPRVSRLAVLAVGLVACAAPARYAESRPLAASAAGYDVQVLVDGSPAPTFWHAGESYVMGRVGERYVIRVSNHTGRRIEAVVTVDGRDVVDGKPGDFRKKRGYLVPAWSHVDIDGWRLSQSRAAVFRFSSVADSYAARMGNAREVGVIGVAVFPERVWRPRPLPPPPPPYYFDDYRDHDYYGYRDGPLGARKRSAAPSTPPPASRPSPAKDALAEGGPASGAAKGRAAAEAASDTYSPYRYERPGLGTEFGEAVSSHIREVGFVRANSRTPAAVLGLRYNDRSGLLAMGVNVDGVYPWPGESYLRRTAAPFPVSPASYRRYAAPPAGWQRY
ncbi:MAG: hypothetical protein JXP73_15665 [Deltaproteobacteria bacterium]|nr:hypothetical protein [Deltaproteobacteria bacterium]